MLKVDLHCHSNVSDGVLTPAGVAAYAHQAGVDVWALTDHDEVGGIKVARAHTSTPAWCAYAATPAGVRTPSETLEWQCRSTFSMTEGTTMKECSLYGSVPRVQGTPAKNVSIMPASSAG